MQFIIPQRTPQNDLMLILFGWRQMIFQFQFGHFHWDVRSYHFLIIQLPFNVSEYVLLGKGLLFLWFIGYE